MKMDISRSIILGIVIITALTLGFTVPGEKGLVSVYHMRQELADIENKNLELRQKNYQLAQRAFLLKENMTYIEHVIIKEMNLVRPDDIIVIFKGKRTH